MTSIDMAGASVSLLKLDDELEMLLNERCETPGLHVKGPEIIMPFTDPYAEEADTSEACYEIETPAPSAGVDEALSLETMIYIVDAMSACIIQNEVFFCELDSHAGDGDFGMSLSKGFRQLKNEWKTIVSRSEDIGGFLDACSLVLMEHCGGASGPIWGSAFRAAGKNAAGKASLSVTEFALMLQAAVTGIQAIGERSFGRGAVVGDKTLIDALVPCADAWTQGAADGLSFKDAFMKGADAAVSGAEKTKDIVARMGRAGTVGERSLGHPDAGAHALGIIFTEIARLVQGI